LEYVGREDGQVKVRGFRIELGEIESVLSQHGGVREALVEAREAGGEKKLVAYYVGQGTAGGPTAGELRQHVKQSLPEYMVPSAFVRLEAFPLTGSGKVDRRALPVPDQSSAAAAGDFVPARDTLEIQLTKIWQEVLGVPTVSVRDNFFDLGGHSLLAVRLFARIEKLLGRNLPLATLFQAPTIEQLASVLRDAHWSAPWSPLVPIKPSGSRPPFYCVHGAGGNIVEFLHLSRYIGAEQPLYGIQAQGLDGKLPWLDRVEDMARLYVKEVRAFQPQGPYYLGGSSFGGLVAYEMAQQFRAQGQPVGLLVLFDTNGPGYPQYPPTVTALHLWWYGLRERVETHWSNLRLSQGDQRWEYVADKWGRVRRYFWKQRRKAQAWVRTQWVHLWLPKALREVRKSGHKASEQYVPQPYAGPVTLFRATEQAHGIIPEPTLGWGKVAVGGLEILDVPGHHGAIIREPRVQFLAEKLTECLRGAQDAVKGSVDRGAEA
jgi:thioesterase domain-containing protein/acyl carrier protein